MQVILNVFFFCSRWRNCKQNTIFCLCLLSSRWYLKHSLRSFPFIYSSIWCSCLNNSAMDELNDDCWQWLNIHCNLPHSADIRRSQLAVMNVCVIGGGGWDGGVSAPFNQFLEDSELYFIFVLLLCTFCITTFSVLQYVNVYKGCLFSPQILSSLDDCICLQR